MREMREVRLYGELRRKFGPSFKFAVNSPGEALRALFANLPEFKKYMHSHSAAGFHVFVGGKSIGADRLGDPTNRPICISPAVAGAGLGGFLQVIVGAVLIAASFLPGVGPTAAMALLGMGASMALGGVVQLLSPQPKLDMGGSESSKNRPSYMFQGVVNTECQGHPVPVLFGELIVGSAVISASVYSEDI